MNVRTLPALPFLFIGAVLWMLSAMILFVGDFISGERHSRELLGF